MNDLDSRLARVLAHIDAHLDERLTSRALAAVAWMSASRLEHLFRDSMGRSLGRYIRDRRVEAAARALRETEAPLQRIALDSGFYDQAHFCRVFKAACHATPQEYRRGAQVWSAAAVPPLWVRDAKRSEVQNEIRP